MGEVTVTEYETVEKEVTRIECDTCGIVVDEEEAVRVKFDKNVGGKFAQWQCDECAEADVPVSLAEFVKLRKVERLKAGLAGKLVWFYLAQLAVSHPLVTWFLWDAGHPWWGAAWLVLGGFVMCFSIALQDFLIGGLFGVEPLAVEPE